MSLFQKGNLLIFSTFFGLFSSFLQAQTTETIPEFKNIYQIIQKGSQSHLRDDAGRLYLLATSVENINQATEAVDLHGQNLKALPPKVFTHPNIKILLLQDNLIDSLPENIGYLKNLQTLNLSNNPIKSLPIGFEKLRKLRHLSLAHTPIEKLPSALLNCQKLQILDLYDTALRALPDDFEHLGELTFLNWGQSQHLVIGSGEDTQETYNEYNLVAPDIVDDTGIPIETPTGTPEKESEPAQPIKRSCFNIKDRQLPENLRGLKKLETILLSGNGLGRVPPVLLQLPSLKYLDLSYNLIPQVPRKVAQLKLLEYLNLNFNNIRELPDSLAYLPKLRSLNLGSNPLMKFPVNFGNFAKLETLNLHGCQLHQLPQSVSQLRSLKKIDLSHNKITQFLNNADQESDGMRELKQLEYLDLSHNAIEVLPNSMEQMRQLRIFLANQNKIKKLPDGFSALTKLERLELSHNRIKRLPKLHSRLRYLTISNNPIGEVEYQRIQISLPICQISYEQPLGQTLLKIARETEQMESLVKNAEQQLKDGKNNFRPTNLAPSYNELAWNQLKTRQFAAAERSLRRGIELDASRLVFYTNLPPALLFQGKTEEAIALYMEWKDKPYGDRKFKDAFLQDFDEFDNYDAIPEESEAAVLKVKDILNKY